MTRLARILAVLWIALPAVALSADGRSMNEFNGRTIVLLCETLAAAEAGTACGTYTVPGYRRDWKLEFHDPGGECSTLSVQMQGRSIALHPTTGDAGEWVAIGNPITDAAAPSVIEGSAFLPPQIRIMPTTVTGCVDAFVTIDLGPEYKKVQ